MLNELLILERGLAANGAAATARHPGVKDMGKGDVFRLRLKDGGGLAAIEFIPPGVRGALWTIRDGQQNGFPGLKTAGSLLQMDGTVRENYEQAWRDAKSGADKRALLRTILDECPLDPGIGVWPKQGHRRRIAERLELLRPLADHPRTAAVPAAFERFLCALDASPTILVALVKALENRVRDGEEYWLDPAWAALTGIAALVVDVEQDHRRFSRDAGDSRQIGPISAALQRKVTTGSSETAAGDCALSGPSVQLLGGNFPQPNLPGLGQTYLFARNPDIPAMARYGQSGASSMPIDAALVGQLSGAILALTEEERRGKTWRLIPAETGDKPDLFVASLPANPELPTADAMTSEDLDAGWSGVETAGESVISLFISGLKSLSPQSEMRILLLRTVDPANRKAVYDRCVTADALHGHAVTWWRQVMCNAPAEITFLVGAKKGMAVHGPPALPPLSLIGLSRRLFANGGTRTVDATGVPAGDALALFMRDGDVNGRARRILELLLQRHRAMLAALAQTEARGSESLKAFDPKTDLRRYALRSIAWIGALLHILDRPKEIYMTEAGFKLGQLLAAMDAVHIGYCADLRGGDIPPTLLGNAVFATAGRHPVRALDILFTRWKPYGAWARRADHVTKKANELIGGKDDKLAWHMRRGLSQAKLAGELCTDLKAHLGEVKPDERFRAELLLGYVAGTKPDRGKDQKDQPTRNAQHGDTE